MSVSNEILTHSTHLIYDEKNLPFSAVDYSLFKYGSKTVASKFGEELANSFIKSRSFFDIVDKHRNKQLVVTVSPYEFIPTATYALKHSFIRILNDKLIDLDMLPVQEVKVYRKASYVIEDYAKMDESFRNAKISNETFYIDAEFIKGKVVLFIDDIFITGGHEKRIRSMITDKNLEIDYCFMYYAKLMNKSIDSAIESRLNLSKVQDLKDINWIIRNHEFRMNTRVCKFIMSKTLEEFKNFIEFQSANFQNILFYNFVGNSYHKTPEYSENYEYLKNQILRNKQL